MACAFVAVRIGCRSADLFVFGLVVFKATTLVVSGRRRSRKCCLRRSWLSYCELSEGTGVVALLLCELVAGLLTSLFDFVSLDGNQIGDVGAAKIAEVLPSTKLTVLQ